MLKKTALFILPALIALLTGCSGEKGTQCERHDTCINDANCLCWCSQICNFRKKTAEDRPFFVENDPNDKFCYCKQWDRDNYKNNCILHKNIKEPKGAK